jgi:hypothetical protein
MIMDEKIKRSNRRKESGLSKILVYADNLITRKSNVSTLEKKLQRVVTVCKDLE